MYSLNGENLPEKERFSDSFFTFGPVDSNKNIANKNNHQTAKAISLF